MIKVFERILGVEFRIRRMTKDDDLLRGVE